MNLISENLLSQVDKEGWDAGIFNEIIDMHKDDLVAIPMGESAFTNMNRREKPVITTKGWDVLT